MSAGKYKPYPEYRDSEVEWLGDFPSNWEVEPSKKVLTLRRELVGTDHASFQLLSLTLRGVITRDISNGEGKIPAEFNSYQIVSPDELIFCLFDIDETPRSIGLSFHEGMITGAYNVYRTSPRYNPNYACFYFLHIDSFKGLKPFYTGLRKVVRADTFGTIKIPIPPLPEQIQIAKFLDYETAKIDELIEKQQELIALLKEKRQAVISHAVTKGLPPEAAQKVGLNPHPPLKDSGIEWLGKVPEHWNVSPLKQHVDTINGFGFSSSHFQDEGVPFIRAGNIKKKSVTQPSIFLPEKIVSAYKRVILKKNDVVISMVGSDPKILESAVGQVGIVPPSLAGAVPNQNVVIMREKGTVLLKSYLFYTLCSSAYRNHLNVFSHKLANQSIISSSLLAAAYFTFPNLKEQKTIVSFLDTEVVKFDSLTAKAKRTVGLLQERRTALISAAVTGKIDVRDWQPPKERKAS
ncbi:restriction endonuclease subunit S [Roseibacillus persicicus]|uniref:Restriction modification system DNA specificity domain-containing protein n=1 Tax=Roseibacillus persicicus TaxID=454148 RepID=A0A918WL47_9BACT|nr:restriction endonuclease subunit S [Roseibacillus persicicus]GHC52978.1 restriction modification system DNA specificity domain-containing protein [Roseibacillus persicicus]